MNETEEVGVKIALAGAGLVSNGRYHVLLTDSGTGYSALDDYALTRWQALGPYGAGGTYLYVQDQDSGLLWSAAHEPTRRRADQYEAWLGPGCFHVRRSDDDVELHTEVCVAPDTPAELRRHTFTNLSSRRRRLRVTSYAEVVMHGAAADAAHPAFSKLFVQTEYLPEIGGVLARRRPRHPQDHFPLVAHTFVRPAEPEADSDRSANLDVLHFDTDRAAFIGRGRSLADPLALSSGEPLSRSVGGVLDPMISLQTEFVLEPDDQQELTFVSAAGRSREEVIGAVAQFRGTMARAEAFLGAALKAQRDRDAFGLGPKNASRYHRLAAGIVLGNSDLRAPVDALGRESGHSGALRSLGLDSSTPLLLARVAGNDELAVARLVLKARDYWTTLGLKTQVVILNDKSGAQADDLQADIKEAIAQSAGGHDGVVLRHSDTLTDDAQRTIQSLAHFVMNGDRIALLHVRSSDPVTDRETTLPDFRRPSSTVSSSRVDAEASSPPDVGDLASFNGYGGFAAEGTEYVVRVAPTSDGYLRLPPMPWVNVVANESGGFLVSETGSGYTWHANGRENRLTPWFNDPVLDPPGEVLYVRDEESGDVWSPTPGPMPSGASVEVRHGMGYTKFHQSSHGLRQSVTAFMPPRDPVKIVRLDLTNGGTQPRRISVSSFARWILGSSVDSARFVVTDYDEEAGAITAVNPQNEPYHELTAFSALITDGDVESTSHTSSSASFLGAEGDVANPAGLNGELDPRTGAGFESCAAFVRTVTIAPGETRSFRWLLGQVAQAGDIPRLINRYGSAEGSAAALEDSTSFWKTLTSRLQIRTPRPEIDRMVNGWLPYQNLSCRIWGRSAFYQSGGAYGFRDQLQDAAAFAATWPHFLREQILLHAAHQFEEGDVMHWWHPLKSRGVRTRFSDDLLWLPYVTLDYLAATGDREILDEQVGYVIGPDVPSDADEVYIEPAVAALEESLYEHCGRAIDRSLTKGRHGLPLIGSGDWNDGMNRVGCEGKGESVWLGFFLFDVLRRFIPVCEARGDTARANEYRSFVDELEVSLNDAGWDGEWYRRAFYDDGAVIGSAHSDEAKIDALVQAWSVISRAAPKDRARQALDAMEHRLVSEHDGIIRLLSPPFDRTDHDPGYIKGYVPGVRENGGQYTHAALWAVKALAEDRRCERAANLLAMLSPISHARSSDDVARYQVEPYVIAADVYGEPPHVGRGGWTWYTGSAGWMHRVAVESILGFRVVEGEALEIDPCIPSSWSEFELHYRHPATGTAYDIRVENPPSEKGSASDRRVTSVKLNGVEVEAVGGKARIPLADDGLRHRVEIRLA